MQLFNAAPIQVNRCTTGVSVGNSKHYLAEKFVGQVESESHPGSDHVMMSLPIRV